ncbi:myocardin [Caerostris darwini]|uniref:Myocardin n=1 Tax=Caerostris darwini TaxID=1538125 RepID=A0AAV4MZ13_9ARAC|nr:myocardin [Caerostris darwini]
MTEQDDQDRANFQNMIDSYLSTRDSKSPPKAQVDEASLQQAMDKNKESLKVKLMMRRPINLLVEQGIMPSPKKPLQYLQQCQKLERAQTENILKHLMKTRPDRQALIDHHILEDTTIDPSLQDKQRQLKKARLADDLNDRLSHRPGPLELVKGNILHTDEKFAQAVKEGQIPFKRTCEGQALRHPMPCFTFEDDSGSDAALSPPQDTLDQSLSNMPSVESMVLSPYPNQDSPSSSMGELRIASSTPPSSQSSPAPSQTGNIISLSETLPKESSTSTTRRKKSKPKAPPKTRTIKFHEYKGPPSAQKNQASLSNEETSYELLLQQQQLFLQWQLEMQQKYPQVILPVPQQPSGDQTKSISCIQNSAIEKSQDTTNSSSPSLVKNLEDLKVNGLKAECKKRNLPVSGSKVQLLERLRNHIESSNNNVKVEKNNCATIETTTVPINVSGIILDTLPTLVTQQAPVSSVVTVDAPIINNRAPQITLSNGTETLMVYNTMPVQGQIMTSRPSSTAPMDVEMNSNADAMDCTENKNTINEEIVKRQQQKIFQLERELERSQRQLQQQQWWQQQQHQAQQQVQQQVLLASHPVPIAPAPPANHVSMATALPQPTVAQAVVQSQLLQPKAQLNTTPQHLLQQARKYPPGSAEQQSALVKASLASFILNNHGNPVQLQNGLASPNQQSITQFTNLKPIVLCQAQTVPAVIEKPRANSLPNGGGQQKMVWSSSVPNFSNVIAPKITVGTIEPKFVLQKAPPDYSEAVKPQIKVKQEKQSSSRKSGRKSVKSQEVDDVLDVLISHGELPPSAAQEPPTPTTPETQKGGQGPPAFPSVGEIKSTLTVPTSSSCNTPEQNAESSMNMNTSSKPQEEKNDPNPPLVFDINLDFQDLEAMDLGVLDRHDMNDPTSQSSSSKLDSLQQHQIQNNCTSSYDLDMDVEFTDWLDILTNNNSVGNTNQNRISSFNGDNNDPLLPSMENGQETLDMFSLDNLDFKLPSDSNLLSWDYAT